MAQRSDYQRILKLHTTDSSRGMPIDANYLLHYWTKSNKHNRNTDIMATEPDKHDLLGFPGVEAEHPKWYIRRLWLVAEDDRVRFPKFLDKDVLELAGHVNKVVNTFVQDEDKRHEELCGDAFLEKDATRILNDLGFGRSIWGEGSGAEARLMSNLEGSRPRWGVDTDSGYEDNDEDRIKLNLRCWMAARIQAQINAPSKEKKREPSVTAEHNELLGKSALQLPQQRPRLAQQEGPSATSENPPSRLEHYMNNFATKVETRPKPKSDRSGSPAPSVNCISFSSFIQTDSEDDLPSKRPKLDTPECRSHTRSQQNIELTSSVGASLPSDASTKITIPDMCNNNTDVDGNGLSGADQMMRKLQLDLTSFLNGELDYAGILREVVPPTKQLYESSPHRKPYSDLYFEFRNFNQALDHWKNLITRVTTSAGVTQSPVQDPLQELAAQETFNARVAMLRNLGPRSHTNFPLEEFSVSLALLFEGLLGDTFMPVPFKDLVRQLRAANQSLYETVAVASDRTTREEDV